MRRHDGGRLQRTQVPELDFGIRAEVFYVHRVVLATFHDAVRIGVPSTGYPGERDRLLHARPEIAQKGVVPGKLPLPVDLHDGPHLPVGGSHLPVLALVRRERHAETHEPRAVVEPVVVLDPPHPPCKIPEEKRRRLFVVPHVRAVSVAGSGGIEDPLPAVHRAVPGAEHGLRPERARIEEGGLLDRGGVTAVQEEAHEGERFLFELREPRVGLLRDVPGVAVERRIVVPHCFRVRPVLPVREIPRQEELNFPCPSGGEIELHGEGRSRRVHFFAERRVMEHAVVRKVVPQIADVRAPALRIQFRPVSRRASRLGGRERDRSPRARVPVDAVGRHRNSRKGRRPPERVPVPPGACRHDRPVERIEFDF